MGIIKKLIFAGTGLLFAFIMVLLLFFVDKTHVYAVRVLPYSNLKIFITGMLFCLISIIFISVFRKKSSVFRKKSEAFLEKNEKILTAMLTLLLLIYEMIFTYSSYFYTDWDPAGILDAAEKIATGNTENISIGYLSAHPNNRFLLWIYTVIYKITIFISGKCRITAILWLQCLLVSLTCLMIYKILRKVGNSSLFSMTVFIATAVYVGMSPWLDVPYSDVATLVLPIAMIYIYLRRRSMVTWMLIGLLTAVGYALKPQVVITTFALIIYSLIAELTGRNRREKEGTLECIVGFAAAIIVFFLVLHGSIFPSLKLNLDVTQEFGVSHYLMMGLNPETDGVYSNADTEFTASFDDKDARNEADIAVVRERIENYGLRGLLRHLMRKMIVNYADGSFAWGINGRFFAGRPDGMETIFSSFFENIIYDSGRYFFQALILAQGIWLLIIFGAIFTFLRLFSKEKESEMNHTDLIAIISLSVIGITLFELTFEALARYLFIYSPFFLLLAADGYRLLLRMIRKGLKLLRLPLSGKEAV